MPLKIANILWLGFILAPMLVAICYFPFAAPFQYILILASISLGWVFGQATVFLAPKKRIENVDDTATKFTRAVSIRILDQDLFYLFSVIFGLLSLIMIFSLQNFGVFGESERLKFEGSIQQKFFLVSLFCFATRNNVSTFVFVLLMTIALLSGWKSNVLYVTAAYGYRFSYIILNVRKYYKLIVVSLSLLLIFAFLNISRQQGRVNLEGVVAFFDTLIYYTLFGFVNLAISVSSLPIEVLFLGGEIPYVLVDPTWNVFSGAFFLVNNFGIIGCFAFFFFLPIICSTNFRGALQKFISFCLFTFFILFHNSFFFQSKILLIFITFLLALRVLYTSSSVISGTAIISPPGRREESY